MSIHSTVTTICPIIHVTVALAPTISACHTKDKKITEFFKRNYTKKMDDDFPLRVMFAKDFGQEVKTYFIPISKISSQQRKFLLDTQPIFNIKVAEILKQHEMHLISVGTMYEGVTIQNALVFTMLDTRSIQRRKEYVWPANYIPVEEPKKRLKLLPPLEDISDSSGEDV